jgi:hypothetical protein
MVIIYLFTDAPLCCPNNRIAKGVNDVERADELLLGVVGKRLTYKSVN